MDTISKFLNHLSATLLGPILLLIKYLLVQAFVGLSYIVTALAFIVLSPVLLGVFLNSMGLNSTLAMIFAILLSPGALFISACLVPIFSFVALSVALFDGLKILFLGMLAGFFQGWDGIVEEFNQPIEYFATITNVLRLFSNTRQQEETDDIQTINLDELKQEAGDFGNDDLNDMSKVNQLREEATNAINPDELKRAQRLVTLHEQTEQLNKEIKRHQELTEKLAELNSQSETGNILFDDELIQQMDISKPILLVKEYCENGKWMVVPGSTKITDYNNLKTWFEQNAINPLDRDSIRSPAPYQGNPCRYVYYPFSLHCKELSECSLRIQNLSKSIKQLTDTLDENKAEPAPVSPKFSLGNSQHSIYNSTSKEKASSLKLSSQIQPSFNEEGITLS